jgi:hypothetical protein
MGEGRGRAAGMEEGRGRAGGAAGGSGRAVGEAGNSGGASADGDPLAIKVRVSGGRVVVRRGGGVIPLTRKTRLRLGDLLVSAGRAAYSLILPGRQWIVGQGRLRIEAAPLKGAGPSPVRVELLGGELRLKATKQGQGVEVRVDDRRIGRGPSRIIAATGEHRVRFARRGVRVEALGGYLRVVGPHAGRTSPPGTGLLLHTRIGFPHQLLSAPRDLRPVRGCWDRPPRLSWAAVPRSEAYLVMIAADAAFVDPKGSWIVRATAAGPRGLAEGKYFWKVVALEGDARGIPSKIYSFTVDRVCRGSPGRAPPRPAR